MLLVGVGQNAWCLKPGGLTGSTEVASGNLTSTITWTLVLESNGMTGIKDVMTLNISGTGDIPDYSRAANVPWARVTVSSTTKDCREYINTINVGEGITRIGNRVFNGTAIKKFNIPSSCTVIGLSAFLNCSSLKEIYIPSTVASLAPSAFNNCSKLNLIHYDGRCTDNTIIMPSGLAAKGKIIEEAGTTASLVRVPTGWDYYTHGVKCHSGAWVAESGTKLFFYGQAAGAGVDYAASGTVASSSQSNPQYHPWRSNCYKYTSLEINRYIASIGENEFLGYSNSDVSKMGYTNMQTITVESGNSNFVVGDDGALYDKNKTKVYLYPAKSTATAIEVPSTVTEIGAGAFYGASNLYMVTIMGTLSTIGEYAFAQANSIDHMYFEIHNSTSPTIATTAFIGLPSKGTVEVDTHKLGLSLWLRELTNSLGNDWKLYEATMARAFISHGILYVKGEKSEYNTYAANADWYSDREDITKIVVEETITNIGEGAFAGCRNVTEVTLNNKGSIDNGAFSYCTSLTRVNIGAGVTGFVTLHNDGIFYDYVAPFFSCRNLSEINIADYKSFCAIGNLDYLINSLYGTADEKTLLINGVAHNANKYFEIPPNESQYPNTPSDIVEYEYKGELRFFSNVKRIKLPNNYIPTVSGFDNHKYLEKISLGSSYTDGISPGAFFDCPSLKWIVCGFGFPPKITGKIVSNPSKIVVKVPSNEVSYYKEADYWKEFDIQGTTTYTYDEYIHPNESKTLDCDIMSMESPSLFADWSTSKDSIATVYDGVVTAYPYATIYDGTTSVYPNTAVIGTRLEDGDTLICNVHVFPSEVKLTDKEVYRNSKDFVAERISYTRTYKSSVVDHWQCFYVPFDIEVTDELLQDYDFAKLYVVCYNDKNNNGFIEDDEPLRMNFNKFSAGRILHANMPYYVRVKSAGTKTIEVTNAELKAAANGTVNCSTTEHEYTLVGVYEQTNLKGLYTMGVSGNFSYYTKDSNLNTYRWYMEVKSRTGNGAELENYARPIEIYVDGEDETTGIVALEDKASASKDDKIYTLDGRKVTGVDNLSSGIYIVNGKKVYKK